MKRFLKLVVVAFVFISTLLITNDTFARRYSRSYTKNVINKTAYIIEQAYDIAFTYDFWSEAYLSKAVYYNDYAYDLYRMNCRSAAVHYSLKARQYALMVIDNCDDYWEFFYFTYFGWSFSFGYNSNFAYASGYANGFYDGYFAAYCNRHNHHYDPHHHHHNPPHGNKPPHHNPHNDNHGNTNHGNGHVIGRGETGSLNPNVVTGGGVITRNSFKNINYDEYFSADEMKDLKDAPNETTLDNNFKKERPNVVFDSKELAKPNNEVIRRNKEISNEYSKDNKDKGQTTITKQIVPASVITSNKEIKPNQETKPVSKETKPASKETKPASKETKPITNKEVKPNKETKPASKETKPASKETKPATNKEVKPNKETKPASKETKPASKEKEVKSNKSSKDVKASKNKTSNRSKATSKASSSSKKANSSSKKTSSSSKKTTSSSKKSEKKLSR